jgi:hypothetical protein
MRQTEVMGMNEIIRRAMLALAVVLGAMGGLSYAGSSAPLGQPSMTPPAAPAMRQDAPHMTGALPHPGHTPPPRAGYP